MKTMTIRGDIEVPETGTSLNHLIFNYQSPDRTRAWKVVRARTWVVDWDSNTSSADKAGMMSAVLATDTIPVNWGYSSSAADNRVFAWNQQQILVRGTTDILIPQAGLFQQADFIIDSDRIITNQLFKNQIFCPGIRRSRKKLRSEIFTFESESNYRKKLLIVFQSYGFLF